MSHKAKLLIIEDEPAILNGLVDVFVYHGYQVDAAADGKQGLQKALEQRYDLILLDIMLPFVDGYSICNQIRAKDLQQAIIMLTAKSSEQDIITGLTLGADDYISKPFSVAELVLRVASVLKRTALHSPFGNIIQIGDMQIDTTNLQQITQNNPKQFTQREMDILTYLMQHQQQPVSREELLEKVWGYRHSESIETRTVDIHIAKLRRKIERKPKQPEFLITVRGKGYRLISS